MMTRFACALALLSLLSFPESTTALTVHIVPHTHECVRATLRSCEHSQPHPRAAAEIMRALPCPRACPPVSHAVVHSHRSDVGWLKTVDEYFSGANNTIQHAAVRNILNTVTDQLRKNPARKFTYVEQAFFQRWWRELSPERQAATRALVKSGQLNFVNGGWCMHDEAAVHYVDMVDQTTLGHRLLKDEFGDDGVVTIGWQLDPFGHSATQAALLSAEAGFDGLFFGRIDYQDLDFRHKEKRSEFIWRASPSLGDDTQIFSGLTGEYGGNYGPPAGFNWNGNDEPVEANPDLSTYNVPSRVEAAVASAVQLGNMTRGEHVMWTMGSDFNYENAEPWFVNMDKLIDAVNADGRITMRYSSPAEYVAAKRSEKSVTWPLTTGDFFPYADGPHQFWTGYFTSRPALKGYVRSTSAVFGAARIAQALAGAKNRTAAGGIERLQTLEEALGVAQHHDAVSGTAKQHVAFDYARRLAAGVAEGVGVLGDSIALLRGGAGGYTACARLNETFCPPTQIAKAGGGAVEVTVWNNLAQARVETIRLPVSSAKVTVKSLATGQLVPSQAYAAGESVSNYARDTAEARHMVAFQAALPPLGYSAYLVTVGAPTPAPRATKTPRSAASAPATAASTVGGHGHGNGKPFAIENEFLAVNFSSKGLIASLFNKEAGVSIDATQTFCYYTSSVGDKASRQRSGAYIFRPKSDDNACHPIATASGGATIDLVVTGGVLQEVRQTFAPWLTQTVRLAAGARHAELEFTVGAVPFTDASANHTLEQCVSWRQTGNCDPNGPREPEHDLGCDKPVPNAASGFCECFGGRKASLEGCGHLGFTCADACKFHTGREVVSRFNTSIASAGGLLTDSNGREMLARKRDWRPMWKFNQTEHVAGNYYPVNAAAAIRDDAAQLTLLVDRASGVGSISDGEMEVMVHRRVLQDDGRGVGEPLNETRDTRSYAAGDGGAHTGPGLVVRGTHLLSLAPPASAAKLWRPLADRAYLPAMPLFGAASAAGGVRGATGSFATPLPPNVQLMTLQALTPSSLLLRLSHQFGLGEDAELSQPVRVDVASLLAPSALKVAKVDEVSLTNSMSKEAVLQKRRANAAWKTDHGGDAATHEWRRGARAGEGGGKASSVISLGPLEIKTFVVTLE